MSLSVAEQYYIAQHRDDPVGELAKTLGLNVRSVRAALKTLPKKEDAPPAPPAKKGLANYDVAAPGVVSMTRAQATADDDFVKEPARNLSKIPGLHVIDPTKPVL